jgi:hypothetical protein
MGANPEALIPAVPPPATAAGAGTEEDENKVKTNMQRWLSVVCANDILIRDEETQLFVESDFGYSPVVRRKQPATGMRRKVIKQFAPPPDNTPELAEARPIVKLFYLGTMDAGQKVDKIVKSRRGEILLLFTGSCNGSNNRQHWVYPSHSSVSHYHISLLKKDILDYPWPTANSEQP